MLKSVIIVGSGPAGVSAALEFAEQGVRPVLVDVGFEAGNVPNIQDNLYSVRKTRDTFGLTVGNQYEGLRNLLGGKSLSPKLTAPYMEFVVRDAERLGPLDENGFTGIQSFACGGLANAWGAGLYRCLDDELEGTPLRTRDLEPYFDKLTKEIGILGEDDDLAPFFGSASNLLRPMSLSRKSERMYGRYRRKRRALNQLGIFVGMPRLGVLTEHYDERRACDYSNLECWLPDLPYVYTPAFTLRKLIKEGKVAYHPGWLATSWERRDPEIVLHCRNARDGAATSFRGELLVLASGTLNTAKIVLSSRGDYTTRLPLLDNPLVQVPLLFPSFLGRANEQHAFALTNLNLVYEARGEGLRLQGSVIELTSPARSLFLEMLPFSFRENLAVLRFMSSGIMAMFLFFPSSKENEGDLRLRSDHTLELRSRPYRLDKAVVRKLVKPIWKMGAVTHPVLFKYAEPGYAIHYAGTIPMCKAPKDPYGCDEHGQLHGEPGVYIVDGSLFPSLPAKNFSFSIMANAMRIANHISRRIVNG